MFARWSVRPFEIISPLCILLIIVGLTAKNAKYIDDIGITILASLILLSFSISLGVLARPLL
jgi:hypothetical protein